jgi:hypothetical protein
LYQLPALVKEGWPKAGVVCKPLVKEGWLKAGVVCKPLVKEGWLKAGVVCPKAEGALRIRDFAKILLGSFECNNFPR